MGEKQGRRGFGWLIAPLLVFAAMALIGPRFAILVWWIVDSTRWEAVYDTFLWPLLGFIAAPWTTLAYTLVAPGGVRWFDWILLGIAVLADIVSLTGGARSRAYDRRRRRSRRA